MNTHLDHQGSQSRYQSAKIIVREIQQVCHQGEGREPLPVLLSGDFNSEPGQEAHQFLNGEGSGIGDLREAMKKEMRYGNENTYTGFESRVEQEKMFDFLFLGPRDGIIGEGDTDIEKRTRKIWRVQSYGVLENRFDGVYCSDHRAVVADVVLN